MRPFNYASTRMLGEQRQRILFELLPAGLRSSGFRLPQSRGYVLCAVPTFLRLAPAAARNVAIIQFLLEPKSGLTRHLQSRHKRCSSTVYCLLRHTASRALTFSGINQMEAVSGLFVLAFCTQRQPISRQVLLSSRVGLEGLARRGVAGPLSSGAVVDGTQCWQVVEGVGFEPTSG